MDERIDPDMSVVHDRLTILRKDLATPTIERINTDLVPPNTEGLKIIVSGVVLIFLTALWTYLRFWSHRQNGRPCLIEDWFNVGAVALFYCLEATDFVMVLVGGMGYHDSELQEWHIVRLLKVSKP